MKNKKSTIMAVLIVLIGVSVCGAILMLSLHKTSPEDGYFNPMKKAAAQKLYDEITSINKENYPLSPEEVVEDYLKGTRLLYGDMIKDETVIPNILRAQREFYSQEILETTTLEQQEENIKNDMKSLESSNSCIVGYNTMSIIFYENSVNNGYIRVTLDDNKGEKYYYRYYVKRDDNGFWKIEGYRKTNENFME